MKKARVFFLSFLIQTLGLVGNVIARIAFGNLLTEEQFGVYNIIILIPNLIALVINLGVGHALSMSISQKDRLEKNVLKFVYYYSILVGVVASIIGFMIFNLVYPDIPNYLILIGSSLTIIYLINYFIGFIFLGLQKSYTYFLSVNLVHLLSPLLFLMSIVFFDISLLIAIIAFSSSLLIVNLFLNLKLLSLRKSFTHSEKDLRETSKKLIDSGKPFYTASVLSFLNHRLDVFIIGVMLPFNLVAHYTIALLFIDSFGKVTQIISILLFQKIPKINDVITKNKLTQQSMMLNIILNVVAGIALIFFANDIINLIFPGRYEQSYEVLLYLIPGMFFLSVFRILYHRIAADGFAKYGAMATFISLCAMILLNLVLIPNLGITGSAIASSISYFIMYIYIHYKYRKVVKESL